MTGSSYFSALSAGTVTPHNCLLIGVTGSSGNRYGLTASAGDIDSSYTHITVRGFGGAGVVGLGTTSTRRFRLWKCTIVNNGGDGVLLPSTASASGIYIVEDSQITGNGGYGINPQGAAPVFVSKTRLRDNTSGNLNSLLNYPTDLENYTTDSDDTSEYVNAAGGDFRIKVGSPTHGKGFGVSDQSPSGGGTFISRQAVSRAGMY
jgi:hypothetical protein